MPGGCCWRQALTLEQCPRHRGVHSHPSLRVCAADGEAGSTVCVCVMLAHALLSLCSVVSDSLRPHGLQPARLLCPWNSLELNTEVGCHFLLQGFFLTQGLNPGLLRCRRILSCWGSPWYTLYEILNESGLSACSLGHERFGLFTTPSSP